MNLDATNQQKWSDLLTQAVTQPGLILKAYSAFHGYSLGNQLGALLQCQLHGIEPGPIDTYKGWLDKGRHVRKGEKAIWLCMPLTRKKTNGDTGEDELYITAFVWKPRWFVLAQTEGEPVSMPEIPEWNKERALAALGIEEIPFTHTNGNVQGYAKKSQVAISPLAELPHKTLFHEVAHVVLLHTAESDISDSEQTPRSLREVEAEAVALLVCESLGLACSEYCRGYIQNWLEGDVIPEKSAQKIFGAADRILKAGINHQAERTQSNANQPLA
jgi:antirestriction protein ArdC